MVRACSLCCHSASGIRHFHLLFAAAIIASLKGFLGGLEEKDKGLLEGCVAAAIEGMAESRQCAAVKAPYKPPTQLGIPCVKTQMPICCNPGHLWVLKTLEVSSGGGFRSLVTAEPLSLRVLWRGVGMVDPMYPIKSCCP